MENTEPKPPERRRLSRIHIGILIGAAVPMVGVGAVGAVGTVTNMQSEFPNSGTALGVVAAGEGGTLILALVMVLVTLLGQSSPTTLRLGLWLLPLVASGTGVVVGDDLKEKVVYAITPLAMIAAAEGLGLIARRVVIYCTGVDMEARRRNAVTMQRMAVLRAKSHNHPWGWYRSYAELASWRLAGKVGVGDDELGAGLVTVQRDRMGKGADKALAEMFALPVTPVTALGPGSVTPALEPAAGRDGSVTATVTDEPVRHEGAALPGLPVTEGVTQVSAAMDAEASHCDAAVADSDCDGVTPPITPSDAKSVTDGAAVTETTVTQPETVTDVTDKDRQASRAGATIEEIATVAGVPVPKPHEPLTDDQLVVVLLHLRYREDPPSSYRQAVRAFRVAGYVGSEDRVRPAWRRLTARETNSAEKTSDVAPAGDDEDEGEEAGQTG